MSDPNVPHVVSVSRDGVHRFSKAVVESITLRENHGVEGDAHAGATVRHRSHAARRPERPNLRQVHLLHAELLDEVAAEGWAVAPGQMGENVTTRGVRLLDLPTDTVLRLGPEASLRLTGLRTPCKQIDGLAPGLMARMLTRDEHGAVVRLAGVMAVVLTPGEVRPGDAVVVVPPDRPHAPLRPV